MEKIRKFLLKQLKKINLYVLFMHLMNMMVNRKNGAPIHIKFFQKIDQTEAQATLMLLM